MKVRSTMVRVLALLAGLLLVPVALVALLLAALQSEAVRVAALDAVNRYVPGVVVEGLGPGLPARLSLDRLALSDDAGRWLELRDLALAWRPTALLGGRLHVDHLTVAAIDVERAPAAGDAAPEPVEEAETTEPAPFALPETLFPVTVDRLAIERLAVGEPLLGQAAVFGLDGRIDGETQDVRAQLALRRLDHGELTVELDAGLDLAADTLALDLAAVERSGLLAAITGEARIEPFTLSLAGTGPVRDWAGKLAVEAGSLARLQTDLGLRLDEPLRLTLDGRVTPGSALTATTMAPLLDGDVTFAAAVNTGIDGTVLEHLTVQAAWLDVDATAALRGENVNASLSAAVPDLAPLSPIAGQDLAGALRLMADVDGALPLPAGDLALMVDDLATAGVTVERIDQRLNVAPTAQDGVAFEAAGTVQGLVVAADSAAVGATTFEEAVTLAARGELEPAGPFAVDHLVVDGRTFTLDGTAAGDLGTGTADAELAFRLPELADFRPLSPAVPTGAATLEISAALADGFQSGTIELRGSGDALAELPPPAGALLGPNPELAVTARLAPLPVVELERLGLNAANLTLDGSGRFDTAALAGNVDVTAGVPDLSLVGEALGQSLAGTLDLTLTGEGRAEDFTARLGLDVDDLVANGEAFQAVGLELTAAGATDAVTGRLDAAATKGDGTLALDADYRATPERLALAALALSGPGLRLDGDLDIGLAPIAVDGRLSGGSDGLAALGRWLGMPLAGTLALDVALDGAGPAGAGGQAADVTAEVRDLAVASLQLAELELRAQARDLLAVPVLDVEVGLGGLVQGATTVERATLDVAGDLQRLDVGVAAAGTLPDPFELTSDAVVAQEDGALRATLEALDAEVAQVPMRLVEPATVRVEGSEVELDGLTLEIDTGRLETRASLGATAVDAALTLDGLELQSLESFGVPPLDGAIDAGFTLTGTRAAPVVAGEVALSGLRQALSEAEPIAFRAQLDLGGGALDAALASDGLGPTPLSATAQLPVQFALEPFVFALPEPLPLDAALDGDIDLGRLTRWYGLDGQEVSGMLRADVTVAGTAVQPDLTGALNLTDGRVVDVAAGVLLEQLALTLEAQGQRLNLADLSATDGGQGRLSGGGGVTFGGEAGVDFDLNAALDRFSVVQREDLFIEMSGTTDVTGAGGDVDVLGRFTVNRGEVFIPKGGGAASFATLDVVTAEEAQARAEAEATAAPAGIVTLDVRVDIPGQLFVRGAGVVSEWGGSVTVEGDATAPVIAGLIEYRRGYVDILDNRFQFRQGEIRLTGVWPPDPFIDIEAEAEAGEITAVLSVRGPVFDPDLALTSEPPGPEDEVLAQLLFDRSNAELNSIQAIKLAAALDQLRGGGQGFLDTLRSGLGLDTLELGGEDVDSASVRAGTYVSEDVFVEVEQGLASGSAGARVEVELTPRFKLETKVTEDQTGSVGLRWTYDY